MKVGFANFSGFVGGAERELIDNAAAMKSDYGVPVLAIIDAANREFAALLDKHGIAYEAVDFHLDRSHGRSTRTFGNIWRVISQARRLRAIQRRHAFDVILTSNFHSHMIAAMARTLGMKAKLIIGHVCRRDLTRGGLLMEHLQFFAADARTYNSNSMRGSYIDLARRYSRPEKVVYSYVKEPKLQDKRGQRERLLAEHGLRSDATIIGYFGHIFEFKRVPDVIDAVAILNAAAPGKFFLMLVGGSSPPAAYETRVRAQARDKCPDQHHFFPYVDDPFPLMSACDVVVMPSIEPFGRVVIEAMHLGVPFVATDVAGPKEIMGYADARCGKLVPPERPDLIAAAINEVLAGPSATAPGVPQPLTREGIVGGMVQFCEQVAAS